MSRILTYNLFEGKKEEDQIQYFNNILESTPEGKDFSRWFDVRPVRTGRFYVKRKRDSEENQGMGIPSKSYFDLGNSGEWYYEFSSSSGIYGTTRGNLQDLLREFMIVGIIKSRPSTIQKKKIEEYFSKESNAPKGKFPSAKEIYDSILKGSGLVSDFSFLKDLPEVKRMEDLGIRVYTGINSFGFAISSMDLFDRTIGKDAYKNTEVIIKSIFGDLFDFKWYNENHDSSGFTFVPFTEKGYRKSIAWGMSGKVIFIKIGESSEEKIKKFVEEKISSFFDGMRLSLKDRNINSTKEIKINSIPDYIRDKVLGKGSPDKEEVNKKFGEEIYEPVELHMKENPLDIHLLDPFPDLKKEILQKTGMKDFSRVGRLKSWGWL